MVGRMTLSMMWMTPLSVIIRVPASCTGIVESDSDSIRGGDKPLIAAHRTDMGADQAQQRLANQSLHCAVC
jgi:hypothetical protein